MILIGHIPKQAAADERPTREGYSGPAGWHNSVRARWYLYPETAHGEENGRQQRTGHLVLELQKSNLGRLDQALRFAWDDDAHLFVVSRLWKPRLTASTAIARSGKGSLMR